MSRPRLQVLGGYVETVYESGCFYYRGTYMRGSPVFEGTSLAWVTEALERHLFRVLPQFERDFQLRRQPPPRPAPTSVPSAGVRVRM